VGIISDIFKSLFSSKKRRTHRFHISGHRDDEEEWSDEGDNSDSMDSSHFYFSNQAVINKDIGDPYLPQSIYGIQESIVSLGFEDLYRRVRYGCTASQVAFIAHRCPGCDLLNAILD